MLSPFGFPFLIFPHCAFTQCVRGGSGEQETPALGVWEGMGNEMRGCKPARGCVLR